MTLTEILPAVLQLTSPDKVRLIRILEDDLNAANEIQPFEHGKTYELRTPYDAYGAAQGLFDALAAFDKETA